MKEYSRPHLKPTGRLAKRQRFGMVMAASGLTPAALAVGESKTAQRHLGFLPILLIWRQQLLDTAALASRAGTAHGTSCTATLSGDILPHAPPPAPSAPPTTASNTTKQTTLNKPAILSGDKCLLVWIYSALPVSVKTEKLGALCLIH